MKKQQEKSMQTKRELEQAAQALFAEKGYEGTSISEIVQRAGYSIGAFYGHFDSKKELARVLWKTIMITDMRETAEKGSAVTDKDELIDLLLRHAEMIHGDKVLDAISPVVTVDPALYAELSPYAVRYLCMVRDALHRWSPSLPEEDVWNRASAIHCLINSYAQWERSWGFVRLTNAGLKKIIRKLIETE